MKFLPAILLFSLALFPFDAWARKPATEYPLTYSGGSLPFNHHKIYAALGSDEVIFIEHSRRIAIPARNITEISYGAAAHRHSIPFVGIEDHYVGVAWSGGVGKRENEQVLLKLSRGEYREFLAALEQITGMKAVDTTHVPTVVRYPL